MANWINRIMTAASAIGATWVFTATPSLPGPLGDMPLLLLGGVLLVVAGVVAYPRLSGGSGMGAGMLRKLTFGAVAVAAVGLVLLRPSILGGVIGVEPAVAVVVGVVGVAYAVTTFGRNDVPQTIQNESNRILGIAVAAVVLMALSWAVGGLFGTQAAAFVFIALAVLSYVTEKSGTFSVPFYISAAVVAMLLAELLLPQPVVAAFSPYVEFLSSRTGLNFTGMSAWQIGTYGIVSILTIWTVQIRVYGRAKKPSTIAKRVRRKAKRLTNEWVTIGRLAIGFGFMVATIFLAEGGTLLGEAGGYIGEAPVVFSHVVTVVVGYLAYVRGAPIVGSLTDVQFWFLIALGLLIAGMVKYND